VYKVIAMNTVCSFFGPLGKYVDVWSSNESIADDASNI